jgi:hypothetical protein
VARTPYAAVVGAPKPLDPTLFALARSLEL